jgi:hypothetical protein
MPGVSNATDYRIVPDDQINKKFLIVQYTCTPTNKIKFYLNYTGGQNAVSSKTNQFEEVVTASIYDKFNTGYNGTINSTGFWDGTKNSESQSRWGNALYLNFDPQPWFGLTLRGGYFSEKII